MPEQQRGAKMNNEFEWLTTKQAGAILKRTSRRVLQLIEAGELEAQKVNARLWMVKRSSVLAYRDTLRE